MERSGIHRRSDQNIRRVSLGSVRAYCYLKRYGLDFSTAIALELIPEDLIKVIFQFEDVFDEAVARRYAYGSIRLTRLDYLTLMFLRRPAYFAEVLAIREIREHSVRKEE